MSKCCKNNGGYKTAAELRNIADSNLLMDHNRSQMIDLLHHAALKGLHEYILSIAGDSQAVIDAKIIFLEGLGYNVTTHSPEGSFGANTQELLVSW